MYLTLNYTIVKVQSCLLLSFLFSSLLLSYQYFLLVCLNLMFPEISFFYPFFFIQVPPWVICKSEYICYKLSLQKWKYLLPTDCWFGLECNLVSNSHSLGNLRPWFKSVSDGKSDVRFLFLCSWPLFFSPFLEAFKTISLPLGVLTFLRVSGVDLVFICPASYLVGSSNLKICVFPSSEKCSIMFLIHPNTLSFYFGSFSNSCWMNGCDLLDLSSVSGLLFHFSLLCVFLVLEEISWTSR